jgi:cytochrome c oxidase assembly factor CtaG
MPAHGHDVPGAYSWSWEPLFLALVLLAAVLYALAARRERVAPWRIASFAAGLLLITVALNSPVETLAVHYLLVIHLLQNVMIADWAPPLLLLGLSPAMVDALARRGGRPLAVLTRAKVALPVWLVGWYAIHYAGFYDAALRNHWLLLLEHALLIGIGLLFWWPVICGKPNPLSTLASVGYLAAAFVGSTFLGLALTFATRPVYDFYEEVPRLWGLSAVQDQNYAGVLMNVEQALVFLVAIGYFVLRLIDEDED